MIRTPFTKLCDTVEVNAKKYRINTDFRIWIQIYIILNNDSITLSDKLISLLMYAFRDKVPDDTQKAVNELLVFLSGNKNSSVDENNSVNNKTQKVIDFVKDESYIYAAFLQQYGIDLYESNLHWWKFLSLLNSLGDQTEMMKIINYRCADLSAIKNKEYKRFLRKMKNHYRIDGEVSEDMISSALM